MALPPSSYSKVSDGKMRPSVFMLDFLWWEDGSNVGINWDWDSEKYGTGWKGLLKYCLKKPRIKQSSSPELLGPKRNWVGWKFGGNKYCPSKSPLYLKVNSLKLLHISSCLLSLEALWFRLIPWWLLPPPLFSLLGSKDSHMFPCKTEWLRRFIFNAPLDSCFRFYMLVREHSNQLWHRLLVKCREWPWRQSFTFWLEICRNLNLFNAIICQYLSDGLLVPALNLIQWWKWWDLPWPMQRWDASCLSPNTSQQPATCLQELPGTSERENHMRELPFFSRWGWPTLPTTTFFLLWQRKGNFEMCSLCKPPKISAESPKEKKHSSPYPFS